MSCFTLPWLCLGLLPLATACGGAAPAEGAPLGHEQPSVEGGTFIAFARDFAGFHDWQSYPVFDEVGVGDPAHPDHLLTEYINQPPAPPGREFPVGTIIVKEPSQGDPLLRQSFAMVKRGGNYNASGVPGWEWFELQNLAQPAGSVDVLWRGYGPPMGEIYGGNARAGCNDCHQMAAHDAVFGPAGG